MNNLRIGLIAVCLLISSCIVGCEALCGYGPGTVTTGTVALNPGVPLETEHNVLVRTSKHVERLGERRGTRHHRFTVLFGPNPPAPGADPPPPGATWGTGRGWILNSAPTWHIEEGYAYAIGWWPIISSRRVRAISQGTQLILQVLTEKDRVFLLDPGPETRVRVELVSNPSVFRILASDENQRYVETVPSETEAGVGLSEPTAIPNDEETQAFIRHVLQAAGSAGE